ncbi:MAG: hypothetical protein LBU27_08455 [Candidatus Peribacteria bacterium]|jgi:hypothetical protein|nr:hypothetical protein [Candidatus Peribacteria bacterium]
MTYPYINHFPHTVQVPRIDEIFPGERSPHFNQNDNPHNWGINDCLVEIGDVDTITKHLPTYFSSGFDDYTFVITQEKSDTSHCRKLLQYDYNLLFYHQKMFCSMKMNQTTKIQDLQLFAPLHLQEVFAD